MTKCLEYSRGRSCGWRAATAHRDGSRNVQMFKMSGKIVIFGNDKLSKSLLRGLGMVLGGLGPVFSALEAVLGDLGRS